MIASLTGLVGHAGLDSVVVEVGGLGLRAHTTPATAVSYTHLDVYKRQVSYLFTRKGVVMVPAQQGARSLTEDDLLEVVLESGAEEVNELDESYEIISEASDFVSVRKALQAAGIDYDSAEASFIPSMEVPLDIDGARRMLRVIEALEDSDDVQNVYANGAISDEILAQLDEE